MSFYRLLGHWASRCRYGHRHESHPSSRLGTCTRLKRLRHPRAPQGCWKSSESQSGFTFNAQLRSLRDLRVRKKQQESRVQALQSHEDSRVYVLHRTAPWYAAAFGFSKSLSTQMTVWSGIDCWPPSAPRTARCRYSYDDWLRSKLWMQNDANIPENTGTAQLAQECGSWGIKIWPMRSRIKLCTILYPLDPLRIP